MANVMFKRGLSAALPKTGLIEGAFYLTTDTDKLYVCNDGKNLSLLNQVVHNVANIAALPAIADVAVGEFYYCLAENVLATKKAASDTQWTQINGDTITQISGMDTSVTASNNVATLKQTVKATVKDKTYANSSATSSVTFTGAGSVAVTGSGTNITITGTDTNTTYSLGTAAKTDGGSIILTGSDTKTSTVTITSTDAANTGLKITSDAKGGIAIDATGLASKVSNAGITSVGNTFDTDGKFTTAIATGSGSVSSAAITPKIKLGTNATEYVFASGTATLPVYTKTEVDTKIDTYFKAADAMVYKGTVSKAADLPTTNVECGWTYKVAAAGTYAGVSCKVGDLIIAKVDAATATDATWDVVPSGDEQTITGAASNTGITISDGAGILAGITMANGDCTTISGSNSGGVATIKVNHNKVTGTLASGSTADVTQAKGESAEFKAITAIQRDAYGHVTGTTVKTFTGIDTHNTVTAVGMSTTHDATGATVTTTIAQSEADAVSTTFKVSSDNLTVTNATTTGSTGAASLKINLEWGSF